ncbi:MAG: hypothetical protein ACFB21_15080 [Opitutales bacterium]
MTRSRRAWLSTLSEGGRALFVFLFDQLHNELLIRGLETETTRDSILVDNRELPAYRRTGASLPAELFSGEVGQVEEN